MPEGREGTPPRKSGDEAELRRCPFPKAFTKSHGFSTDNSLADRITVYKQNHQKDCKFPRNKRKQTADCLRRAANPWEAQEGASPLPSRSSSAFPFLPPPSLSSLSASRSWPSGPALEGPWLHTCMSLGPWPAPAQPSAFSSPSDAGGTPPDEAQALGCKWAQGGRPPTTLPCPASRPLSCNNSSENLPQSPSSALALCPTPPWAKAGGC